MNVNQTLDKGFVVVGEWLHRARAFMKIMLIVLLCIFLTTDYGWLD